MSWVQPQGLALDPAGAHLPGVLPLALHACHGTASYPAKTAAEEGSASCSLLPSRATCSSVHPGRALGLWGQVGQSQWNLCTMGTLGMGERRWRNLHALWWLYRLSLVSTHLPPPWWFSAKSTALCEMWLISSSLIVLQPLLRYRKIKTRAMHCHRFLVWSLLMGSQAKIWMPPDLKIVLIW